MRDIAMSRSQQPYASTRTKTTDESHRNASTETEDRSRSCTQGQTHSRSPHQPMGSDLRPGTPSRSASSSPVPACSIIPIQRLSDLRIGDHVTWSDRGSPMLVVEIGYRHVGSVPPTVPAREHDQPTRELCVTLRGKNGGECELYHRPDGPIPLIAVPLSKFGWVDMLYRLDPRTPNRSSTRVHTPEGSKATEESSR